MSETALTRRTGIAKIAAVTVASVLLWLANATPAAAQHQSFSVAMEGSSSLRLCMTCHGAYGQGNPTVGGPKLAGMEPWYLQKQLESFRSGFRGAETDYIPAYEMRETVAGFTDEQISQVVVQITQWPDEPVAPTVTGDAAHGQELYQPCAACHGADGEGNEALGAPALAERNDWYLLSQLKLFRSGYRGSHPDDTAGQQMRLMMENLETIKDMEDLIAHINTLN